MSRKSQKKRHTKPCKYFQVNKCPHSAEVCDFAHVIATPAVSPERVSTMCRYYLSGQCHNGSLCRYHHGAEALDYLSQSQFDATSLSPYSSYSTAYGQVRPPQHFFPSVTFPESVLFAPPHSRDSIDSASNSISSLDLDEAIVITDDPKYSEHSHSHQSQVHIADESPIIHVPPFYPSVHMNMISPSGVYDYGASNAITAASLLEPKPRTHPKPMSKQKTLKYKTKPCKFFTTERGCPNGNSCTFVHDKSQDQSHSSSPRPMSPVKYPSLTDETDKKNFFPITWRVIGGGVRMGVVKNDECVRSFVDTGATSQHSIQKQPPPLKIPVRRRSNSIPPTPSNVLINVEHLFSAESPGVL